LSARLCSRLAPGIDSQRRIRRYQRARENQIFIVLLPWGYLSVADGDQGHLSTKVFLFADALSSVEALPIDSPSPFADCMGLLPRDKQGNLMLLKSELHYLQVLTGKKSSALVIYHLGDIINQLPKHSGTSTHCFYWVAFWCD